jgi:hypothetical protein
MSNHCSPLENTLQDYFELHPTTPSKSAKLELCLSPCRGTFVDQTWDQEKETSSNFASCNL